jgi:hypothetical protein
LQLLKHNKGGFIPPFLLAISIVMQPYTFFSGYTLVDITETGVTRDRGTQELERNQQRNWETVLQCIGLRAQPMHMVCKVSRAELSEYEFGEMYTGMHQIWSFAFTVEHENVFQKEKDKLYYINQSFDQVPIITGLNETARFLLPIFYTSGAIKNMYFKIDRIHLNN